EFFHIGYLVVKIGKSSAAQTAILRVIALKLRDNDWTGLEGEIISPPDGIREGEQGLISILGTKVRCVSRVQLWYGSHVRVTGKEGDLLVVEPVPSA
ncbi:MAG: hypothetical protein ACRD3D_07050, partial [Terriglobia bacterium]